MNTADIQFRLNTLTVELQQQACQLLEHAPEQQTDMLGQLINLFIDRQMDRHPLYFRLLKLDAAKCQLELGLFGLCADCEEEIESWLLQEDVTTQRCACCQARYLNQHRQELKLNH